MGREQNGRPFTPRAPALLPSANRAPGSPTGSSTPTQGAGRDVKLCDRTQPAMGSPSRAHSAARSHAVKAGGMEQLALLLPAPQGRAGSCHLHGHCSHLHQKASSGISFATSKLWGKRHRQLNGHLAPTIRGHSSSARHQDYKADVTAGMRAWISPSSSARRQDLAAPARHAAVTHAAPRA